MAEAATLIGAKNMYDNVFYGRIEAGGTTFVAAVADGEGEIHDEREFPTGTPEETYSQLGDFFDEYPNLAALGVAHFGPFDLNPESPTYGYALDTPKADTGWKNVNVEGMLRERRGEKIPIVYSGDVDAALIGEAAYGAAVGHTDCACLHVGTGIGAGAMVKGNLAGGTQGSPEAGHLRINRAVDDTFEGACLYHGDCLEGLASGKAIDMRKQQGETRIWGRQAYYLAQGIGNLIAMVRPNVVIVGGGVMAHEGLFEKTCRRVEELNGGYLKLPEIARPKYKNAGVRGAVKLALSATALRNSEA